MASFSRETLARRLCAMGLPEQVVDKLGALPAQPGVYLFKDREGVVVYVGKAKSLRSRVRSYFQSGSSDTRSFIPLLMRVIGDIDTIVAANEKEATILENNLIKEHKPRYNVKLRDDKDFLCLRITTGHAWPRLDVVRRPAQDGAKYFGPYHSATAARRTLHLVNKHFQLRTCSDTELASRKRPCLQFQIKRCPAPCVYEVDRAFYGEQVQSVAWFLEGRHDELSRALASKMREAATDYRYELAAVYRDQLRAIDAVHEEQRVVTVDAADRDVLGLHREGDLAELAVLYVRAGRLQDVVTFHFKHTEVPDDELIAAFIAQHYGGADLEQGQVAALVPEELIVPVLPEGALGIEEWLAERAGHKVRIVHPKRGARVDLLTMAIDNARHAFTEKKRAAADIDERLAQLQARLRLPTLPRRIECCDISHLGGNDTVGAIVAMSDGELDKKRYRSFRVRGTNMAAAGDDYGAMYEVLARRFRRGRTESKGEGEATLGDASWDLPDLFVVDGGRGQLAVALAAARDLGLHELPIVALAKEKENVLGETLVDRVYLPGQKNPIPLKSHSASLFFLARLRDEAHRFSNRGRKTTGKRRQFHSALDDVRGLGPKTRKALLRHLGTLEAVLSADDARLLAVPGVTKKHVAALRAAFSPSPSNEASGDETPASDAGDDAFPRDPHDAHPVSS